MKVGGAYEKGQAMTTSSKLVLGLTLFLAAVVPQGQAVVQANEHLESLGLLNGVGLEDDGLRKEMGVHADALAVHLDLLENAVAGRDLAGMKSHANHLDCISNGLDGCPLDNGVPVANLASTIRELAQDVREHTEPGNTARLHAGIILNGISYTQSSQGLTGDVELEAERVEHFADIVRSTDNPDHVRVAAGTLVEIATNLENAVRTLAEHMFSMGKVPAN